jgi:hypothetical protein
LEKFFYARGYDARATKAIIVDEVFSAVMNQLSAAAPAAKAIASQSNEPSQPTVLAKGPQSYS